jgi:hypothetical protein
VVVIHTESTDQWCWKGQQAVVLESLVAGRC